MGLCAFAAGTAFSISFTNWSIFPFVLIPLILVADLARENPAYRTAIDLPFLAIYISAVASSFAAAAAGGEEFLSRSFSWVYRYTAPLAFYAVAYSVYRRDRRIIVAMFVAFVAAAAVNSAYACYQFWDRLTDSVYIMTNRPGGRMFYMTYGGVMVTACSVAVAAVVKAKMKPLVRVALAAALSVMLAGLAVSLVRSAWLGLGVSVLVIGAVAERRLLWSFPVIFLLALLIAPRQIVDRAATIFKLGSALEGSSVETTENETRVEIWKTYARIAHDYPVFGIGLHNSQYIYDRYRDTNAPVSETPHAHNNYLQVWVERGVVGFVAFVALVYALFAIFIRAYRRAPPGSITRVVGLAGIGTVSAFLVEGLFEYTFGDFEIMVLIYGLAGTAVALMKRETENLAAKAGAS